MINLVCNEGCGQEFILISYGTEIVKDDVERVGFSCPHCGKVYTAYYQNSVTKQLQEELAALQRKLRRGISAKQADSLDKRIRKTKRKLAAAMDDLRKEVEAG
ncbi:MAG: hypothetical protein BAA01_09465 [Bacillus thermozeamaize]|uniref:Transglycosylase n=1 Tax=Bacillus thermozeamaize TaxID=230954 RepID=A0A1Y3PHU1_9BACI|nr:MAG: hypothetical protein BAA01_09465 [Bacillus thermozeamaize]